MIKPEGLYSMITIEKNTDMAAAIIRHQEVVSGNRKRFARWMRRGSRMAAAAGLSAMLVGCGSFLSGAGPTKGAILNGADGQVAYDLIDLSADTIAAYMRPAEPALSTTVSATPAPDIHLVPGDVISAIISDSAIEGAVFAPLSAGGTVFSNLRVDSKGTISVPYAGRVKVEGLTLPAVEDALRKRLEKVASDPQVHVEMVGDLSGSVLVAGAVASPGRFSALQGPLTLLDAINQAGGPTLEPHLIRVVVRTGSEVKSYGYDEILAGKNMPVPPRSEIIVERARQRFVAMGAVTKPGLFDLPSRNPSLLEVLGTVGGLSERSADARGVFVFRLNDRPAEGEPAAQVFRLDMRDPASMFLARQFQVKPEDAIYVTNATVYEAQKIISPIVQVLVLGRTIDGL